MKQFRVKKRDEAEPPPGSYAKVTVSNAPWLAAPTPLNASSHTHGVTPGLATAPIVDGYTVTCLSCGWKATEKVNRAQPGTSLVHAIGKHNMEYQVKTHLQSHAVSHTTTSLGLTSHNHQVPQPPIFLTTVDFV